MRDENMERIYVAGPSITQHEIDAVTNAVTHGWYDDAFTCIEKFEEQFKQYVGRKYSIAMPSCTSSIHVALMACGIGVGDEVIIPDVTWIATASPVSYLGATPVFADMEKASWCVSLETIKKNVTVRTKAIILVDLYGNMPEMDEILTFAKSRNIKVIEDSAQSLGSEYKGRMAGSFGDFSVFSFHGTKILTAGEGGMLLTDDEQLYKRCLKLRDLGRSDTGRLFWNDEVAHKYKMSNIQAALGLAQLQRFDEILAHKRQLFAYYHAKLDDTPGIALNSTPDYVKSNYWMNTVLWDCAMYPAEKEEIMRIMKEQWNIDTRPFFYPLTSMPAYKHLANCGYDMKNRVAYAITPYGINLPSSMRLDNRMVEFVCEKFLSVLETFKR